MIIYLLLSCLSFFQAQNKIGTFDYRMLSNDCHLYDLVYEQTDCDTSGDFTMYLYCNHDNTSDSFDLYIDGVLTNSYPYSALPISLSHLEGDGQFHVYKLIDKDNSDCFVVEEIKHRDCSGGGDCHLYDMVYEQTDCDTSGDFTMYLYCNHDNTSDSFDLYIDGVLTNSYPYSALPIALNHLEGDGLYHAYKFIDKGNDDCRVAREILHPDCSSGGDCHLYDMVYEQTDCDTSGDFTMYLYCNHDNTSDSFDLYIDGVLTNSYPYSALPIALNHLEGDGEYHVYKFIDNDDGDCKVVKEIKHPECNTGGDCHLYDLGYNQSNCDSSGYFNLYLNFQHDNVSDSFKLFIDGVLEGIYPYTPLPLSVNHLEGDGDVHVVKVVDQGNDDCKVVKEIKYPDCSTGGDCHLYDMVYEKSDCDASGTFNLWLNCNHENVSDSFRLFIDGVLAGVYPYSALPLELNHLEGDGDVHAVKVVDQGNDDCKVVKEIKYPDCSTGGDCHLYDMVYEKSDCDTSGTFNLWLNCNHDHVSDSFRLFIDGVLAGVYPYSALPLELNHLEGDGDVHVYKIIDQGNDDCKVVKEIKHSDCSTGGDCHLYDMVYEKSDCDTSGTFYLWLNCNHENVSDSFRLFIDGVLAGIYPYSALPLELNHLEGDGDVHVYKIIDQGNDDCKVVKEIKHPDCDVSDDCHLTELTISPSNCNDEGQFYIELNFNHSNTSDSFNIRGNGHLYGHFRYVDLPIVLGPFDGNSSESYEFGIMDLDHPDCKVDGFITPPYCENGFPQPLISLTINDLHCIDSVNYTATVGLDIGGEGQVDLTLSQGNSTLSDFSSEDFPVSVTLSKNKLATLTAKVKDQPKNFTALIYQHPDCTVSSVHFNKPDFRYYPNPVYSELTLAWPGHYFTYRIHGIDGASMLEGRGYDTTVVRTDNLPAGTYIVQLIDGNESLIKKFIK
ncbi:MAG: T9SS type A sorting domain-containing protein [Saprospiraceae bacterium]|nr:T9SS type A sorting domain-containing protein [Saprospiraceae bacterium]